MIDLISFLNSQLIGSTAVGCFLPWILFIWKEWNPSPNFHFYLRIFLALVSLVALAMIALKPMIFHETKTSPAVLLTKGYDAGRLDSLRKVHKNLKVIPYNRNKPIGSVLDSVSSLFVIGKGIRDFDFWQLKGVETNYLGKPKINGITKLKYNQQSTVGEELTVSGWYENPPKGNRMILADPSGIGLDSVILEPNTIFRLAAGLKVKGNYTYELIEKDSLGSLINTEPLPISVVDKTALKVLLVNGFPTFETKYLKNYLAEMGHEVIVRSQLTRGKYKFEYFNTERKPIYSLSQKQLKGFDIVFMDANSYLNLSKGSLQALDDAVKNDGLGLFIQPEASLFRVSSKISGFDFLKQSGSKTRINEWPSLTFEKFPYAFAKDGTLEELHRTNETILTAYKRSENGRIGTTALQNTYQLLLNGNTEAYQRFWSEIISKMSKRMISTTGWDGLAQFAFQDEPYRIKVRTRIEKPELIASVAKQIPLLQDPDVPTVWTGTTYPNKIGWNQLNIKNDTISRFDFYVMDTTTWKSLKSYTSILKNRIQFDGSSEKAMARKIRSPINQFWFFLVFLLGMGWLWLSPKLYSK